MCFQHQLNYYHSSSRTMELGQKRKYDELLKIG